MKILIIGANSYIGARLYTDLKREFGDVVGTFHSNHLFKELEKLDVRDPEKVSAIVEKTKPEVIINMIANPSAAWCAEHPKEAEELNVGGARNVLNAANKAHAKLVYISTRNVLYGTDVYAKTKLEAQEISKTADAGWLIIQPGHVIGVSPNTTNDRFFNNMMHDVKTRRETTWDDSAKLGPTWIGHISEIITVAIRKGIWRQTVQAVSPALKTRYEMAKDMLTGFGITVNPRDDKLSGAKSVPDDSQLAKLGMPTHTYEDTIARIIEEIDRQNPGLGTGKHS